MSNTAEPYVDLYLLPVRAAELDRYREQALAFGRVAVELGALSYRELVGDDLDESLAVEDGMVLTAAIAEFASREDRDAIMERVMADERVEALMAAESPADMSRMRFGGFRPLLRA